MKKLITICLMAVLFGTSYTRASILVVQSQQYHVWGKAIDSYDIAGETPVSGSMMKGADGYVSSSADLLSVSAASAGGMTTFFWAQAEGDWVFSPQTEGCSLDLRINCGHMYFYDPIKVLLEDVTNGNQLLSFDGCMMNFETPTPLVPAFTTFQLDPSHQYHMHSYIESTASRDGPWHGSIQATVTPEPATLLLLGFGVPIISGLRRKR
jgi:hypothetical protein